MNQSQDRRLAAILAADAVGFTSRMAKDESGTLRALKANFEEIERSVALHDGRIVKTLGDGVLVEFGSVVNAVSAAADIQKRLTSRNTNLPENSKFLFRIGVHVGDVVVDGDDILGDGVNVAARLESQAEPGGVLVSGRVYEDVIGKLDLEFDNLGERELKGIVRPLKVFSLSKFAQPKEPEQPKLPDKPSIAVLPFVNMATNVEEDYFADGLTEDIITGLASVPWLFVIARNSSFIYKGSAVDVRKVGHDLGVRYILEGSVRRSGSRLRITGQLVDAETRAHIWADRIDGSLDNAFALQDEVTESVITAIAPEIGVAEQQRVARKAPDSLTAYDYVLRAMAAVNRAQINEGVAYLDHAIEASPGYAKALSMRAWFYTLQVGWNVTGDHENELRSAVRLARQALDAASDDTEVSAYAAYALGWCGEDIDRSLNILRSATTRCPSFMWAWASLGMLEGLQGDPEAGVTPSNQAIRLSPRDPMAFRAYLAKCCALKYAERFDEFILAARATLEVHPSLLTPRVQLLEAMVATGNDEELDKTRLELFSRYPEITISHVKLANQHYLNFQRQEGKILERLRAAGLPE